MTKEQTQAFRFLKALGNAAQVLNDLVQQNNDLYDKNYLIGIERRDFKDERDEARKLAHEWRRSSFSEGAVGDGACITKETLFPWESDEVIGRAGEDVTYENTKLKTPIDWSKPTCYF